MSLTSRGDIGRRRAFYGAVLLDAVSGTVIAVASIAHQFSAVPFPGMSRLRDMTTFMGFTFGGAVSGIFNAWCARRLLHPLHLRRPDWRR